MSIAEQERLAALHEYRLLDAPADDELEAVVRITVSAGRHDGDLVISVADNGIGIPEAQRRRVFEMFARVDRSGAGHGVGLSTCQRIVERHHGRIWAGPTPGGGTTVSFTMPGA